jgi:hypothetical protein
MDAVYSSEAMVSFLECYEPQDCSMDLHRFDNFK